MIFRAAICSAFMLSVMISGEVFGQSFYVLQWTSSDEEPGTQLLRLNYSTGQIVAIGDIGFERVNSLTLGPDGYLYSVGQGESTFDNQLIRIDPVTGIGEQVASLDFGTELISVRGLSFVGDQLYLINLMPTVSIGIPITPLGGPMHLWQYDFARDSSLLIDTFDELFGLQSLATTEDGRLVSHDGGGVFPDSGQQGLVELSATGDGYSSFGLTSPSPNQLFQALDFSLDGTLFTLELNGTLAEYDIQNSPGTLLGNHFFDLRNARGLALVPEPTTAVIWLTAFSVINARSGRRNKTWCKLISGNN